MPKHKSIYERDTAYKQGQHSTWSKGERPVTTATVSTPGKASVYSRMFGKAKESLVSSIKKNVKGILKPSKSNASDPNAAQRKKADAKQQGMKGMFDLITGVRSASLVAGIAKTIAKKK